VYDYDRDGGHGQNYVQTEKVGEEKARIQKGKREFFSSFS